jgi:hypothetical protein
VQTSAVDLDHQPADADRLQRADPHAKHRQAFRRHGRRQARQRAVLELQPLCRPGLRFDAVAGMHIAFHALPARQELVRPGGADQRAVQRLADDVLHLLRQLQQQRQPAAAHDLGHQRLLVRQRYLRARRFGLRRRLPARGQGAQQQALHAGAGKVVHAQCAAASGGLARKGQKTVRAGTPPRRRRLK